MERNNMKRDTWLLCGVAIVFVIGSYCAGLNEGRKLSVSDTKSLDTLTLDPIAMETNSFRVHTDGGCNLNIPGGSTLVVRFEK